MRRILTHRTFWIACYGLVVAAASALVWWNVEGRALTQLEARGTSDLALAGDGLQNELARFRNLAVVVAEHPDVSQILGDGREIGQADVLLRLADKTGALDIIVTDTTGAELATASGTTAEQHDGRPYFTRAMHGAMGVYHQVSERYDRRAFLFAAPVFGDGGPVQGVVLVATDLEAVESSWRGGQPSVFFTDELGVIFVSSRSEMVLRSMTGNVTAAGLSAEYKTGDVAPFRQVERSDWRGHTIWKMNGGRYLPDEGMHLTRDFPVIGLRGEVLLDVRPARRLALVQAATTAALGGAIGLVLFWLMARRRTLAETNQRLEARVAERTAELRALNDDLQREVTERREAQAALTQAQADLVQAGKLSALGQMSAGVSHELNQPLMAIQSFAENAGAFLERGKPEVAAQNLDRIGKLAKRMGRIIRSLRAFARQDTDTLRTVDLVAVVDEVVEMTIARMEREGVTLEWARPGGPVPVRGGDVRLQQVVLNLVTNALDAMDGTAGRVLALTLSRAAAQVVLTVRDSGPGLKEPEKVFEPFYSTKQLPDQEGMGLGLSISYGLVQSFGGEIQGRNHPEGGAVFTVTLDAAEPAREVA